MNEREIFLEAIRSDPDEDTHRLVFADWLDENDESDLDRATAEFVRLSCNRSGNAKMPEAAYQWLWSFRIGNFGTRISRVVKVFNWKRLVPGLIAQHTQRWNDDLNLEDSPDGARRIGRRIHTAVRLKFAVPGNDGIPHFYRITPVNLWFRRGFLECFQVHHQASREMLWPILLADQPFAQWYDAKTHALDGVAKPCLSK